MKSSRDDLYHLEWFGQAIGSMTEKENLYSPIGIRPAWECISVNDIPSEKFIPQVEELIGYLPEFRCIKTEDYSQTWILFKTEEDAMAFKLAFQEKSKLD